MSLNIVVLLSLAVVCVLGDKTFERCELAKTLMGFGADRNDVGIWVCIANFESSYRTNIKGPLATGGVNTDGSTDFGVFQINSGYWCDGKPNDCGIPCSALLDDDITDDFTCAKLIKDRTGFEAWTTYAPNCQNDGTVEEYLKDCGV